MRVNATDVGSVFQCVDEGVVWHPPVGERVRVRRDLDGRCPEGAHDGAEPGHVGIVVSVRGACGVSSHPYLVLFDDPHPVMMVWDRAVELPVRHYAVEELEPLPALT